MHSGAVYFLWKGPQLLYIGCTKDISDRLRMHRAAGKFRAASYGVIVLGWDRATAFHVPDLWLRDVEWDYICAYPTPYNAELTHGTAKKQRPSFANGDAVLTWGVFPRPYRWWETGLDFLKSGLWRSLPALREPNRVAGFNQFLDDYEADRKVPGKRSNVKGRKHKQELSELVKEAAQSLRAYARE